MVAVVARVGKKNPNKDVSWEVLEYSSTIIIGLLGANGTDANDGTDGTDGTDENDVRRRLRWTVSLTDEG